MWTSFDELPCLIAEDSGDDLKILERGLGLAKIVNPRVIAASDEETIGVLERTRFDHPCDPFPVILFLDLLMPKMSGFEVLKWLRDQPHPPLPVVLHTGVEDDGLLERARELGASFHLPKGARPEALKEVFRRARLEHERYQLSAHS